MRGAQNTITAGDIQTCFLVIIIASILYNLEKHDIFLRTAVIYCMTNFNLFNLDLIKDFDNIFKLIKNQYQFMILLIFHLRRSRKADRFYV